MVNYVTLATSMGGWGVAIGGVTYVTRNIYGRGGACQDMQSDVHCLRFSAVPSGKCFASRGLPSMRVELANPAGHCRPRVEVS